MSASRRDPKAHASERSGETAKTATMDADIADIYRIAFGGDTSPDRWQQRFGSDEWPEILIAPTGSGKTAGVTLGWASHRLRAPAATPRRLVWCLPMRTLAEQTATEVRSWFHRLQARDRTEGVLPRPEEVHLLMGGIEASRWLDRPERPAVIIGTQDMLLSRALMRGYASSRAIWPMEFALLHEDAQWVFDEVQLMGAGRATSAQLEAFRRLEAQRGEHMGRSRCPARSLWISATLQADWLRTVDFAPAKSAIRRVDPQTAQDARIRRLATAKKTLMTQPDLAPASLKAPDVKAYVNQFARTVLDAHRPGRLTLVIVNRVQRAQDLRAALAKELAKNGASPVLALVHGRFRPADRRRELDKLAVARKHGGAGDLIVVATQAVEAGVDISAAVLFTELAPWPSLVQRFGRANRYAELADGAEVHWIDLLAHARDDKAAEALSLPYTAADLEDARGHLRALPDVAPAHLPPPGDLDPPQRVIRRKDLDDLFDTDPDLTGFDVDISPYVRDVADADVRVFWRDLSRVGGDPPRPQAEELCAVPVGGARDWLQKLKKARSPGAHVFVRDPQWRRREEPPGAGPAGWTPLTHDPWPGLMLLAEVGAGGYDKGSGFTGDPKHRPSLVVDADTLPAGASERRHVRGADDGGEAEGHDEDPRSELGVPVLLTLHQRRVEAEAQSLCAALGVDDDTRGVIVRAARWHDVGKVHAVFQDTMRRGLGDRASADEALLAKTVKSTKHERAYFRHELASALAVLAHDAWSRSADLIAYLVAAHHGKVRMNLRALPREQAPPDSPRSGARFARGVWEGDELQPLDLGGGERWAGGRLTLSTMELGWDETTQESWTERTRALLTRFGPFLLAWMEALVRLADWRASAQERHARGGDDGDA